MVKAIKAIAKQKGENPEQRLCLEIHKMAKRDAFSLYGLPYRCYYNYLRDRAKNPSNKIMINPCYPRPGYPVDSILRVSKKDFVIPDGASKGSRIESEIYTYDNLKPEIKEKVGLLKARFCPWTENYDTNWKRYFLKYLKGYDFDNFACFDFLGTSEGELQETEFADQDQIELMKRVYKRLQDEYNELPSLYDFEDPDDCDEYHYLYQDKPFILERTKEEVNEEIERAKVMGKPLTPAEIAACYKMYGLE